MKNRLVVCLLLIICIAAQSFSVPVLAENAPPSLNVDAKAAVLLEPTTGKILLAQNMHEKLPIASVTKVMTILLVYEAVESGKISWDDIVTVSDHAAGMGGSQIYLEPMEKQTVRDLLKSVIIASANDSAVALAEFIAGSEDGFVILMNKRAASLGMLDTTFKNACGLDTEGHLSSAYDVAMMSKELILKFPEVLQISSIWMDTITHKTARGEEDFGLSNTNKLIRAYNGASGLKTGSTSEALFCITATATREGMQLVSVILGGPTSEIRFHEAVRMFDYGFANYVVIQGESSGTPKGVVNVNKGEKEQVGVAIKKQINCLVPKGKNVVVDSKVEILPAIDAPVPIGTKAGEIIYYADGEEVGRSDLIAMDNINKAGLFDTLRMGIKKWFR